jgi:hypothetical protein
VRVMDEIAFEGMLEARVPLCVPGRVLLKGV